MTNLPALSAASIAFAVMAAGTASAAAPESFAAIEPVFRTHCFGCHGPDKAESDLRLDRLDPDLENGPDRDHWRAVYDRLSLGDMPPESATPLADADRERLTGWLLAEMRRSELALEPVTHFRRLTRHEYERTLQDLLGLPLELAGRLPEDGRSHNGFRNDGATLRMSPLHVELFTQIAEEAVGRVIVEGPPPAAHRYRIARTADGKLDVTVLPKADGQPCESFGYDPKNDKQPRIKIRNMSPVTRDKKKEEEAAAAKEEAAKEEAAKEGKPLEEGKPLPETAPEPEIDPDALLAPAGPRGHAPLYTIHPLSFRPCFAVAFKEVFAPGEARVRVRVARVREADGGGDPARPPVLAVGWGTSSDFHTYLEPLGPPVVIDHDDYRVHEFRFRVDNMPPRVGGDRDFTLLLAWNAARKIKDEARPPRLQIDWIELETPFLASWPPASHRAILFPNEGGPDGKPLDEAAYARGVIERFASRAFRRPIEPAESDRLMAYWTSVRRDASSFEASIRETLTVILASPQVLTLSTATNPAAPSAVGTPAAAGRVDDHELASRLSYFLWGTMPDETLLALARAGTLHTPATLVEQVRRMAADPRSWQFVTQFTEQWLELDRLQRLVIQRSHYPDFDDDLATVARLETVHFVADMLREDRSLLSLSDAEHTFLNETLAAHYGITGVSGPEFRRVALRPEYHRGGVLSHAAILAATSDGVEGHPIKRGMWLLKNLLDEPPPPPPPNVPELERKDAKTRAMTVRQLLAAHRGSPACAGCHKRIDPWGLAFEEYDAVGNWQRDGVGAALRKKRTVHPVDAVAELPTGTTVDGLRPMQAELLRSKADSLRRAVSRKLLAYALGRSLSLADIDAADRIATTVRDRGDGFRSLVELIVQSETFQAR